MALNKWIGMGRITKDLELKQTPQGVSVLSFTVAIDRNYTKQGEEKQSDFINCVAWRQTAEFISRYFGRGRMIAIEGTLRTRTYDDQKGTKHFVTEVMVEQASFTGEKQQNNGQPSGYANNPQGGYPQQNNYQGNYPQQGGYPQQGSYPQQNQPAASPNDSLNIGDMDDFAGLTDDGVPF